MIGQAVSEQKISENHGHIRVYSPGAVADNPLGPFDFQQHKSSVNLVICCKFFPLNGFVIVFRIKRHKGQLQVIIYSPFVELQSSSFKIIRFSCTGEDF